MSKLDITSLKSNVETAIAALSTSSSIEDLMLVAASVNNLTEYRIVSVASGTELPNLYDDTGFPSGTVFFVESLKVPVFSIGTKWYGLDGRLYRDDYPTTITMAWGYNVYGQLSDDTTVDKSSPVTVVGGITNWSSVSASLYHNLGVTDAGIAYAWGLNNNGQLGDNTTVNKSSPVTVVGGITNWSSVSAGLYHSLGVTDAGVAYAWGLNNYGQLGDGTTATKSSPVTVVGDITNWSLVSAGRYHNLGVTDAGVAYAWGYNVYGVLGDDTTVNKSSPVTVVGGITNWSSVSAGRYHSLGVTDTGVAYAWGDNDYGQLGDDTTVYKSSPVTVVGGITNWSSVSAGSYHSLGVTDAGVAYAWGDNDYGQLGDGSQYVNKSSPVTVVGGITNWSLIAAGFYYSLGVTDTGVAYAWGDNSSGQLGDNTTASKSSPVTVVGGITNWSSVSAGGYHSLGIFTQE